MRILFYGRKFYSAGKKSRTVTAVQWLNLKREKDAWLVVRSLPGILLDNVAGIADFIRCSFQ